MKLVMTPDQCLELLPKWRSVQKPAEFVALLKRAIALPAKTVVEIGVHWGGTLRAWQAVLPEGALIVAVDRSIENIDDSTALLVRNTPDTILIGGDSQSLETLSKVGSALKGRPVDVLWIDGDHEYKGVSADFSNYSQFVRPGGLIAFHDIAECPTQPWVGVRRFWLEIKNTMPNEEIIGEPLGWGGIGILKVP